MENLILPGLLLVVYVAIVYPTVKRKRDQRNLLAALEEGDEIVLDSGLHGFITALDPTVVYIEVSDGVELKYNRSAVAGKLKPEVEEETT